MKTDAYHDCGHRPRIHDKRKRLQEAIEKEKLDVAEFNRIKTAELQEEKTRIAELERENAELRAVISTCHSVLFDVLMDGCEFEGDNPPDLVKAIKLCSETERAGRKKNPTSPRSVSSVNKEETI